MAITRDLTRVMSRLKAIYRSWAIPGAGQQVNAPRYPAEWLAKIAEGGARRRAELYYQQFDGLAALRQQARRELLAESQKHSVVKLLRQIPSIGPIRAALLVALMQTPHRFRTKRQLGNDNDYDDGEGQRATREGEENEGFFGLLSGLQVEPAPGAQNDSLRLQLTQQQHPTARQQVTAKTRA